MSKSLCSPERHLNPSKTHTLPQPLPLHTCKQLVENLNEYLEACGIQHHLSLVTHYSVPTASYCKCRPKSPQVLILTNIWSYKPIQYQVLNQDNHITTKRPTTNHHATPSCKKSLWAWSARIKGQAVIKNPTASWE